MGDESESFQLSSLSWQTGELPGNTLAICSGKAVNALILHAAPTTASVSVAAHIQSLRSRQAKHNDFTCRSITHPNPVVFLHGLGATYYEDLNVLEAYLQSLEFCTFSFTYGAYPGFEAIGGLKPISDSALEISKFIQTVYTQTGGNNSIDIVGHSEGAFQSLYVPKFYPQTSSIISQIIAIAPPTHGTTFASTYNLTTLLSRLTPPSLVTTALSLFGCPACADLFGPTGPAIQRLNSNGPVVQPPNELTVIISRADELVTPTSTAFVLEDGVRNWYVQDFCPDDAVVGHLGEAYDLNVWNLAVNVLERQIGRTFTCGVGSPG